MSNTPSSELSRRAHCYQLTKLGEWILKERFHELEALQSASRVSIDLNEWVPDMIKVSMELRELLDEEFIKVNWGTTIKIMHATQGELATFSFPEKEPAREYFDGIPVHVDRGVALEQILDVVWPFDDNEDQTTTLRHKLLYDKAHPLHSCQIRLKEREVKPGKWELEINLSLHDDVIAMNRRRAAAKAVSEEKDPVRKRKLQDAIDLENREMYKSILGSIPSVLEKHGMKMTEEQLEEFHERNQVEESGGESTSIGGDDAAVVVVKVKKEGPKKKAKKQKKKTQEEPEDTSSTSSSSSSLRTTRAQSRKSR